MVFAAARAARTRRSVALMMKNMEGIVTKDRRVPQKRKDAAIRGRVRACVIKECRRRLVVEGRRVLLTPLSKSETARGTAGGHIYQRFLRMVILGQTVTAVTTLNSILALSGANGGFFSPGGQGEMLVLQHISHGHYCSAAGMLLVMLSQHECRC